MLELDYSLLPIGKSIKQTDSNGYDIAPLIIPDSLSLFFIKKGLIDTTQVLDFAISLEEQ